MAAENTGFVRTETIEGATHITFAHPAHNSLPGHLLAELSKAIEWAGEDAATKVVVLRSGGDRTFCAGASFDELAAIRDEQQGKQFFSGFAGVINAIRRCPKMVIGRIQGRAVGGGVGLAAAVDYALATHFSTIRLSELAIGIGPFVIGPAVERKIGLSAFSKMSLTPTEWQTAEWARDRGLYHEVFPDIAQMDAYLGDLCQKLASYHPQAIADMKKMFWQGADHWDQLLEERAAVSGRLVLSDFTQEAIRKIR